MKRIGRISIILTAVFIVSFVITILAGPIQLFSGFESANVNQFESLSQNGIEKLQVNLLDTQLKVSVIDGNEFTFNLAGSYAKNQYDNSIELYVKKIGSTAEVKVNFPQRIVIINRQLYLEIGVPKDYDRDFLISTASGDIYIRDIAAGKLNVNSASGNINIINSVCYSLNVNDVSGEVNIEDVISLKDSHIETVSGRINSRDLKSEESRFKSISGDILIDNSRRINYAETTSGDIEIRNLKIDNELNLKSISGDINLDLIEGSSVDLNFGSVSGELNNSFGEVHQGENKIYARTTSGDLEIY